MRSIPPIPSRIKSKLIGWMNAAIMQQRLTGRSPLPPVPDFDQFDRQAWLRTQQPLEVRTAARDEEKPLSAAQLEQRITQYNAALNEVVSGLYASRRLDVDELNAIVDRIANWAYRALAFRPVPCDSPWKKRGSSRRSTRSTTRSRWHG